MFSDMMRSPTAKNCLSRLGFRLCARFAPTGARKTAEAASVTNAAMFTYPTENGARAGSSSPAIMKPIAPGRPIATPKPAAVATAV